MLPEMISRIRIVPFYFIHIVSNFDDYPWLLNLVFEFHVADSKIFFRK